MPEIFDDRPINANRPVDRRAVVEFAPGFFVPANRTDELAEEILSNPDVANAIEDIAAERSAADDLSDDLCIYVPFWFLALLEQQLATALYMKSLETAAKARHVQSVYLSYGQS